MHFRCDRRRLRMDFIYSHNTGLRMTETAPLYKDIKHRLAGYHLKKNNERVNLAIWIEELSMNQIKIYVLWILKLKTSLVEM